MKPKGEIIQGKETKLDSIVNPREYRISGEKSSGFTKTVMEEARAQRNQYVENVQLDLIELENSENRENVEYLSGQIREWREILHSRKTEHMTYEICENIKKAGPEDWVTLALECEGNDAGYMHVYGYMEAI